MLKFIGKNWTKLMSSLKTLGLKDSSKPKQSLIDLKIYQKLNSKPFFDIYFVFREKFPLTAFFDEYQKAIE